MIDEEIKTQLLQELEKSGNVYFACLKTNVHRSTYYRWKGESEEFKIKAEQAEHLGRANNCDIAEQALMLNVKDKKMDAIKYLLSHNSPKYKGKEPSQVIILHKKDIPPEPQKINLTAIFQEIMKSHEEKRRLEEENNKEEAHSDGTKPESTND
jgi:hypothetical protein